MLGTPGAASPVECTEDKGPRDQHLGENMVGQAERSGGWLWDGQSGKALRAGPGLTAERAVQMVTRRLVWIAALSLACKELRLSEPQLPHR